MDLKKTGSLIAAIRKEKGLTQKDLACLLGVTDKAVSRWETGKGFPEVSLLEPLAKVLEISITEIVNGERTTPEESASQSDRAVISALRYSKGMLRTLFAVILAILGGAMLLAPLYVLGANNGMLIVLGAALLVTAAGIRWIRKPLPVKLTRWLSLLSLLLAVILAVIPGSAAMVFAGGPDRQFIKYTSCFDLTLVGYANAAPFISAVLMVAALLLTVLILFGKGLKVRNAVFIMTILAGLFMLLPLGLFGSQWFTPMGLGIVICCAGSAFCQASSNGTEQ